FCLVAVGATMVGKIRLSFDDMESNLGGVRRRQEKTYDDALRFERCEEWGRFHFGSTLVLVATPGTLRLDVGERGEPLRLGRRIGDLSAETPRG
ncbi:MAG: phosphatidylserine decarboxylase, partial [Acidobacteriota bacterium]